MGKRGRAGAGGQVLASEGGQRWSASERRPLTPLLAADNQGEVRLHS